MPKKCKGPCVPAGASAQNTRAPVSRILFPRASTRYSAIYLGSRSRVTSIDLPAGIGRAVLFLPEGGSPGLFGLSARRVYQAAIITDGAVVSCTTLSPLPVPFGHRRSPLCCTFRGTTVTSGAPSR